MNESPRILTPKEQYSVAFHEAAHVVVRYLLFGNIFPIEYVSIVPNNHNLGRVKEYESIKRMEQKHAVDYEDDVTEIGGYAYKECCYSLAGVIADKIMGNLDDVPFNNSDDDWESLYSFLDCCNEERINKLVEAAIPATEELIKRNMLLIKLIANFLVSRQRLNALDLYDLLQAELS